MRIRPPGETGLAAKKILGKWKQNDPLISESERNSLFWGIHNDEVGRGEFDTEYIEVIYQMGRVLGHLHYELLWVGGGRRTGGLVTGKLPKGYQGQETAVSQAYAHPERTDK